MRATDVAIVGGGIMGCAVAFQLTQLGFTDVVVLEKGKLAGGATGVCPGGIRQQFETEPDCMLARHSMVRFWNQVNEILEPDMPFIFERSGYLFLAESEEVLDQFRKNVATQNRVGIPSEVLGPPEVRAIVPELLLEGVIGGAFCGEDGFLEDCHGVTNALATRTRERGGRVVYAEVRELRRSAGGWELLTADDSLQAKRVVLAAGADSVPLAAGAGVQLPIVAENRRLAYTAPYGPTVMQPLVIALERGFAGKQLRGGVFYFGWLQETEAADDLTFMEKGLEAGLSVWPGFEDLPVRRVSTGVYDQTPDHRPILGPAGPDGLYLAVGFSGHGFMIAPAVAEMVAAQVLGTATALPAADFVLERFASMSGKEGLYI